MTKDVAFYYKTVSRPATKRERLNAWWNAVKSSFEDLVYNIKCAPSKSTYEFVQCPKEEAQFSMGVDEYPMRAQTSQ